jgi:hypothetical protein
MPVRIEIQDNHIQSLIGFYINRLRILREEIIGRENEFKEISATIQQLKRKGEMPKTSSVHVQVNLSDYTENWPWLRKVRFVMEQKNKPLTTKDIAETLTDFEPSLLIDRKRAIASISSILSSKSGEGKDFLRVGNGPGDFAYVINPNKNGGESTQNETPNWDDEKMPF